jgi:hypothetical protein
MLISQPGAAHPTCVHNRHHNIFSLARGNRIEFDTENVTLAKMAFFPRGEAP